MQPQLFGGRFCVQHDRVVVAALAVITRGSVGTRREQVAIGYPERQRETVLRNSISRRNLTPPEVSLARVSRQNVVQNLGNQLVPIAAGHLTARAPS